MRKPISRMILTLGGAALLSMSAQAGDRISAQETDGAKAKMAQEEPASCQGGKGWTKLITVDPSDIGYRVKGKVLTPGGLKPAAFERILEENQCIGAVLNGPQKTSCRYSERDSKYQCSAGRFIQIEKSDRSEWSEADILQTMRRYTEVRCCIAHDDVDLDAEADAEAGLDAPVEVAP